MTNIMDMYKLKVIKYSKNPDYKTNKNKKGKKYIWNTFQDTIDQSFLKKSNWGIVCNKMSGLFGLDLDTHKWEKDNLFNKDWGDIESFINNIDTYTQTTPNGGIHMVFQYDDEIDQTESKMNSNFGKGIDIRNGHDNKINSGGYLLGAGSVFKKPDGTIGTYKIVNDKLIWKDIKNKKLKYDLYDGESNKVVYQSKKKVLDMLEMKEWQMKYV